MFERILGADNEGMPHCNTISGVGATWTMTTEAHPYTMQMLMIAGRDGRPMSRLAEKEELRRGCLRPATMAGSAGRMVRGRKFVRR